MPRHNVVMGNAAWQAFATTVLAIVALYVLWASFFHGRPSRQTLPVRLVAACILVVGGVVEAGIRLMGRKAAHPDG